MPVCIFLWMFLQIGVPLDPACLYGTSPPPSQQQQEVQVQSSATATSNLAAGSDGVNEADLGSFLQLSVVEDMLDKGQGLEAGLQGVAMTRYAEREGVVVCSHAEDREQGLKGQAA